METVSTGSANSMGNADPIPSLTEYYGPDEAELRANELAQQADLETLNKLLEADDVLAEAHTETKRLNHLVGQLQIRIAVLMREKNAAIDMVKKYQAKEKRQMDLNRIAHKSN